MTINEAIEVLRDAREEIGGQSWVENSEGILVSISIDENEDGEQVVSVT